MTPRSQFTISILPRRSIPACSRSILRITRSRRAEPCPQWFAFHHGRDKCSVRGHGRHPFGDMTDTFAARQVDGGDLMGGEENAVLGTAWRRPDGKTLSAEGLRNLPEPALEADVSLGGRYGPHN